MNTGECKMQTCRSVPHGKVDVANSHPRFSEGKVASTMSRREHKMLVSIGMVLCITTSFAQEHVSPAFKNPTQQVLEESVPERYRSSVRAEISEKAFLSATAEASEKFNLVFAPNAWSNQCGKGLIITAVWRGGSALFKYDKDGRLVEVRPAPFSDCREWAWRMKRREELIDQFLQNRDVVTAILSNVVRKTSAESTEQMTGRLLGSIRSRRLRRERESRRVLEDLIPLQEAMALAKEGKGKGFYQLAMRYAQGKDLPQDWSLAYKMLCKARDVDYPNAVLVEGMCDEQYLRDPNAMWRCPEVPFTAYFGFHRFDVPARESNRDYDCLTNTVAFARVMGKYEKAKKLGLLTATNQIAALNKRLDEFNKKVAETAKAEENSKRLTSLLNTGASQDAKKQVKNTEGSIGLLEELISLSEALALAKKGEGKGLYQIAMRYAQGKELPQDWSSASKMLTMSRDVNYSNAVLVDGLCDELYLWDTDAAIYWPSSACHYLKLYCGSEFFALATKEKRHNHDLLTNTVAFARVMGKYEKAKKLGLLTATNQIAALNKRLDEFNKKAAETAKAEENSKQLASLLGSADKSKEEDNRAKMESERVAGRTRQRRQSLAIQEELRRAREEKKKWSKDLEEMKRSNLLPKVQKAAKELFGYELGQRVDEEMKFGRGIQKKLTKPYRYFDSCTLTGADGRILGIESRFSAGGKYSLRSCLAEAEAVAKDLTDRYGLKFSIEKRSEYFEARIDNGGLSVRVNCSDEGDGCITLTFYDRELSSQLWRQERQKRESQKPSLPLFGK